MNRESFHDGGGSGWSSCCVTVAEAGGMVRLKILRKRRARVVLPEDEGPDRPSRIVVGFSEDSFRWSEAGWDGSMISIFDIDGEGGWEG